MEEETKVEGEEVVTPVEMPMDGEETPEEMPTEEEKKEEEAM